MSDHELTIRRIAENQSTFREANEDIELAADKLMLGGPVPFICECPRPECTELVRLTLDQYEEIRQETRRFFTAPGHEDITVEAKAGVVIEKYPGYTVIDKVGKAGEIAAERYDELTDGGGEAAARESFP